MKLTNSVAWAVLSAIVITSGNRAISQEPLVLRGHTSLVSTVAWATDGKTLATAGNDRSIRFWDSSTGEQTSIQADIAKAGYGGPVVAFTKDLAIEAINYRGEIKIVHVADGKVLATIDPILDRGQKRSFRPDVFAMAFSPDGKKLVTAGSIAAVGGSHGFSGGIVIVWDSSTGNMLFKSDKLSTAASSVSWSADGTRFAVGTNGAGGELPEPGEVWVWDAETSKVLNNFQVKPTVKYGEWASASDVAFSPDGKRIAVPITAGGRGTPAGLLLNDTGASVVVWDLSTGKGVQPIERLKASVARIVFSPDSERLATASSDKIVRIWEAATGKQLLELLSSARVGSIAFSPDGKSIAAGSEDGTVRIWMTPANLGEPTRK